MRVLVVGAAGQVGQALQLAPRAAGETLLALTRADLDLTDDVAVRTRLQLLLPDIVINAAAWTDVERAETEEAAARAINADAVGVLASAAAGVGAGLIHLSTDFVFDGQKGAPYAESDTTAPLNAYGRSKLAGEAAVIAQSGLPRLIVRTSWVYSPWGRNFVRTMLRLAAQRDVVRVVDDQSGNPTSAIDLVDALLMLARRLRAGNAPASPQGVLHVAAPDEAVWADVAEAVFAASLELGGPHAEVERISTEAFGSNVARPKDSRLDCSLLHMGYGYELPGWRASVANTVRRILAGDRGVA